MAGYVTTFIIREADADDYNCQGIDYNQPHKNIPQIAAVNIPLGLNNNPRRLCMQCLCVWIAQASCKNVVIYDC